MSPNQEHVMQHIPFCKPSGLIQVQRGLSLIVVLLALVTMAFAAVALIRSIDTGTLIMGNLSFKKAATASSDQSVDTAVAWIQANLSGATLNTNATANGYYATSLSSLDPSGNANDATRARVDWAGDNCGGCVSADSCLACMTPSASTTTSDGYSHSYVITRMCKTEEDPNATTNSCVLPTTTSAGVSPKKGELKYGDNVRFTNSGSPYFRIIVRTSGPRNTATITETYVHF